MQPDQVSPTFRRLAALAASMEREAANLRSFQSVLSPIEHVRLLEYQHMHARISNQRQEITRLQRECERLSGIRTRVHAARVDVAAFERDQLHADYRRKIDAWRQVAVDRMREGETTQQLSMEFLKAHAELACSL